jgi:acyl-CoA synthetase (AMP-forming)/AMP-acid ligase II
LRTITAKTPTAEFLFDWTARWAVETPDAPAFTYLGHEWTWAQWNERVRRGAGALRAAGIKRGDRIAFLEKNNPACLEITLAAASIGAAIAIINWRQAGDELAYCFQDSAAKIVFAGDEFVPGIAAIREQLVGVKRTVIVGGIEDEYEDFLAAAPPADPADDVEETDIALVIYSSGTTGRPKGVLLSQQALVAHTINVGKQFPFTCGDKHLISMPLFHVGGACWAFFGIRAGVPNYMTRDPDVPSLIGGLRSGATHTFLVPAVIAGLLEPGAPARGALAGLKYLAYGAAPMPLPTLKNALAAWPGVNFVQVYGQTEVSGVTCTLDPTDHRDVDRDHLLASAGKPVPGTEIRIVETATHEVAPTGEAGEIWLRTVQAMTGYLNRPDATVETITADGWVRTGDIGRLDADGYLYVEDRLKDMIITGGENVYGPEVERVLLDHPVIVDAAVIGVPDDHWGESVKAVIVTNRDMSTEEVITFCRERLAGYKCPRTVDIVSSLPRNPGGKILKRELRQPYWSGHNRSI